MNKKIVKILFTIIISLVFATNIFAVSNSTSLKDLKDKLAKEKETVNIIAAKQKKIQETIKSLENELGENADEITKCDNLVQESKQKVIELQEEIDSKQQEIDNLLNFLEVSNGENVYLEYMFKAKSFTDFIYRAAVVEQLTKYNDELIDDMYKLIDENKKEQVKLAKKIEEAEAAIDKLNTTLKKYNLSMDDLMDDHKDAKADYEASKKEVAAYEKMYKENNCSETTSILDCIDIPYADGFVRPTTKGSITSEYGMRYHPTLHYYRMHNGVDIGVAMNTPVYAAAAGIVSKIVKVANPNKKNSSCGGNAVYIKHRVNGKEYTSVYMHLHSINVKLNDFVTIKTVVGKSGGGESYDYCTTGPHLHFGLQKTGSYVNPRNYINFPAKGKSFSTRW